MGLDLTKFDKSVSDFNKKYNTNFSLAAYETKVEVMGNFGGGTSVDVTYKGMFAALCRMFIISTIEEKNISGCSLIAMMDEFETNIMRPYSKEAKSNKLNHPKPYGGLKKEDRIDYLKHVLGNIPKNATELAKWRYQNGEIRIRDMVEVANNADKSNSDTIINLEKLGAYAQALESVNAERSFWWKVFHPFRNNAEKREARNIRAKIKDVVDNTFSLAAGQEEQIYKSANMTFAQIKVFESELNAEVDLMKIRVNLNKASLFKVDNNEENLQNELIKNEDGLEKREQITVHIENSENVGYSNQIKQGSDERVVEKTKG